MAKRLKVVQPAPPVEEVAAEVIASSIVQIADALRKLRNTRLNDRALVLLIQNAAVGSVSQRDVKNVLAGIAALEATYLKKAGY